MIRIFKLKNMPNRFIADGRKNYWWISLISGLILVFFGIWFFSAPLESFKTLTILFGIVIFISGVLEIYVALKNRRVVLDYWSYLLGGILNTVLGFLLILNPTTILIIISVIISFWLIFKGGERIKKAIELKNVNHENWKNPLIFGLILILIAAILLWHPNIIGFTVALWTSVSFILLGIFRIYLAFKIKELNS